MQRNLLYFALLLHCVESQDDYCDDVKHAENPAQKAFEMALDVNTNSWGERTKKLCRIVPGKSSSACDAYAIYSDDEGEHWFGLNWDGEEQDGATGCLGTKGSPWSQDRQYEFFYDHYFMTGYCGCSCDDATNIGNEDINIINCGGKRFLKKKISSSSSEEEEVILMKHARDESTLYHGEKYCKIIPGVASSKCDEYAVYSDDGISSWKGLNWDGEEQNGATGCLGLKTNPWSEQEKQDYYLKHYHYGICGCNEQATPKNKDEKEEKGTGKKKKKGKCPKGSIKLSNKEAKIEFEKFSNAYDVESKNLGSHRYKGDKHGVDLKDVGKKIVVSHVRNGEWLEYQLDASKFDKRDGFYIQFNYARKYSSMVRVHVFRNEDEVGIYEFSNTGNWDTHTMTDWNAIYVPGNDSCIVLRFEFEGEKINLDYFIIHI